VAFLTKYRAQFIGVALTLFLGIVIAVLTLAPVSSQDVPGSDKLHHALAFAALAFPLSFARSRLALPVALGVIAYGGMIELIQPYFGRQAEWADFLADILGAITGATLGAQSGKWYRRYWSSEEAGAGDAKG
jgi:VanZ family protein